MSDVPRIICIECVYCYARSWQLISAVLVTSGVVVSGVVAMSSAVMLGVVMSGVVMMDVKVSLISDTQLIRSSIDSPVTVTCSGEPSERYCQ